MITVNTTNCGTVFIKFRHHRPPNSIKVVKRGPKPKKIALEDSYTECTIKFSEDDKAYFGRATCHPMDQFNKTVGRELALNRALEEIPDLDGLTKIQILLAYDNRNERNING